MPYVIVTRDKPNSLSVRTENRAVHLDYLNQHKAKLLAAGGLIEDDGTGGTGPDGGPQRVSPEEARRLLEHPTQPHGDRRAG